MKDEQITVMILRAGEFMAEVKTIPHELEKMQELVGGCFDIVRGEYMLPPELQNSVLAKYDIFVNDEGIIRGLEPNICLNPEAALKKKIMTMQGCCLVTSSLQAMIPRATLFPLTGLI